MRRHLLDEAPMRHLARTPAPRLAGKLPGRVLALQRLVGNRAVGAVLSRQPDEKAFVESLRAVHESQRGVPLNYNEYPVTQVHAVTGKYSKNNRWREAKKRQPFGQGEADGSFCLGAARGIAVRKTFGLGKPTYFSVLTDLKVRIEAAKKSGAKADEVKALISRIVSHSHRPGPLEQFNEDLESRYGIKNVLFKNAEKADAFAAIEAGASVLADLDGAWHWVMVSKLPGTRKLWKNDPLSDGVKPIAASELGDRFEIIVDANTGKPIIPANVANYEK